MEQMIDIIYFQGNKQLLDIKLLSVMDKNSQKNSIQVFIRVRPLISIQENTQNVVVVHSDNKTIKVQHDTYNQLEMNFDQAFSQQCDQGHIFQHFKHVVPKVMQGFNATIFAYGQTGSGKTYTMFGAQFQGKKDLSYQDVQTNYGKAGIIPRVVNQLFRKVRKQGNITVFCSFLQIYNEKIYDLLQDMQKPKPLNIRQSKADGIFVQGLTQFGVENYQDCLELMQRGLRNRNVRQTSMNAKSSRSHSIFQILLESNSQNGVCKGRLNLCDLAGSQKINKKQAMGQAQLKQLKNINLSLTTLGKVINALSSGDKSKAIGVFRQSKLTRLLQDSLTGNTLTFIVANLSPSLKNMQQTMNTLKFVQRAHHITMTVKPTNMTQNPDTIAKLQRQVLYLRDMLQLKKQGVNPQDVPQHLAKLKFQNQRLRKKQMPNQELQKLMKENREMKRSINQLQEQLQLGNKSQSLTSNYVQQLKQNKIDYYMPSSRGASSRKNSQDSRVSVSLIHAGNNIAFNKNTIQASPNRAKEKKSIIQKLQTIEDKRMTRQHKLIEDYQGYGQKNRYSPLKKQHSKGEVGASRQQIQPVARLRKRPDYSNKIKELQAKLYGK